jgi:hypothetical protein
VQDNDVIEAANQHHDLFYIQGESAQDCRKRMNCCGAALPIPQQPLQLGGMFLVLHGYDTFM